MRLSMFSRFLLNSSLVTRPTVLLLNSSSKKSILDCPNLSQTSSQRLIPTITFILVGALRKFSASWSFFFFSISVISISLNIFQNNYIYKQMNQIQFQDNLSAWTQSNNSSLIVPPPKVKPNISIKFFQKRNTSTHEGNRGKIQYERPKTQTNANKIAELKNLMTFLQQDNGTKYNSSIKFQQTVVNKDMKSERVESQLPKTLPPKPHIFNLKSDRNIKKEEGIKQYKQLTAFNHLEILNKQERPKRLQSCRVDRKLSGILPSTSQGKRVKQQRRTIQDKKQTFHFTNEKIDEQMEKFIKTEMNCFCEFSERKKKIEEREKRLRRLLK